MPVMDSPVRRRKPSTPNRLAIQRRLPPPMSDDGHHPQSAHFTHSLFLFTSIHDDNMSSPFDIRIVLMYL